MPCIETIKLQLMEKISNLTDKGFNRNLVDANQIAKRVNKTFKQEVVSFKMGTDQLLRNIDVDTLAEVYYQKELAIEEMEARNVQKFDAERVGVDFNDRYLYDDMIVANDNNFNNFNYSNYIDAKSNLKRVVDKRVDILLNKSNKEKSDLEQIEELKELSRRLNKDLINLKNETKALTNYTEYFTKDIEIIKDLLTSPTLENLSMVKDYINTLEYLSSTEEGSFLQNTFEEVIDKIKEVKKLPANKVKPEDLQYLNYTEIEIKELQDKFNKFQSEVQLLKDDLNNKETKIIHAEIKYHLQRNSDKQLTEKELEQEVIDLYKKEVEGFNKDLNVVSMYMNTTDSFSSEILHKILQRVFDDAVAKSNRKKLRKDFSDFKPKLVAELKRLGKVTNSTILGGLYNNIDYSMFRETTRDGFTRLRSKFSSTYSSFIKKEKGMLAKIKNLEFKKNKSTAEYAKLETEKDKHFNILNNSVDFIDITRIPEILNDPELSKTYSGSFKTPEISEDYKKELIDRIGEKEYNKIVQGQLEKIYSFKIAMEQYERRLLKTYAETDVRNVPEKEYNQYLDAFYTKNPFVFAETFSVNGNNRVSKMFYQNGKQYYNHNAIASMDHISYVPKAGNDVFFDQVFSQEIESNPVLLQAWNYMAESLEYINQNGHTGKKNSNTLDYSLTHQRNEFQAHLRSGDKFIKLLSKSTMSWINKVLSSSKYVDTNDTTKLEINGEIKTIDQVVQRRISSLLGVLKQKYKVDVKKFEYFANLTEEVKDYLGEQMGVKNSVIEFYTGTIESFLKSQVSEKVLGEQELDLVETLLSQVETIEKFKAKREIETKMKFLLNKIKDVKKHKNDKVGRERAIKIAEFFIEKQLYGVNNRANFNLYKPTEAGRLVYSTEEKETRKVLFESKAELEKLPLTDKIAKEIVAIDSFLESQGRVVTSGSVIEATLLKLIRFKAFAFNFCSQSKNVFVGDFNAYEVEGKSWTEGNYPKAKSYVRKWKKIGDTFDKKSKENKVLTTLLLNRVQVFQNSANEIFKVEESSTKSTVGKVLRNPMQLPGEVEKTIQRPQILAAMGDIMMTDKNGNQVPIFDVNNLSNPHPGFIIDSNGSLELKEEFNTEENKATWITNDSQEYADLFGDSGKIPKIISYINGDYRDSSTYLLEKFMGSSIAFVFKRWLPATLKKKYGIYGQLIQEGSTKESSAVTGQSAALYGLNAAGIFGSVGMAAGLGIYAAEVGKNMHKQALEENKKMLFILGKNLTKSLLSHKFYIRNSRVTAAASVKALQMITNPLLGKSVISNNIVNKVAGFDKTVSNEQSLENLQFLMTTYAKTLLFTALRVAIHALLYPDDDEKDEYDKSGGFYERLGKDPDTTLYYILENTTSSLIDDVNLTFSPGNLSRSLIPMHDSRSVKNMVKMFTDLGGYMSGEVYVSGENAGKSKLGVALKRMALPSAYDDFSLGFKSSSLRDFNNRDLISKSYASDFTKMDKKRKQLRATKKNELKDLWKDRYPTKKRLDSEITKELAKYYPSIKKYFNKEGEQIRNIPNQDMYE